MPNLTKSAGHSVIISYKGIRFLAITQPFFLKIGRKFLSIGVEKSWVWALFVNFDFVWPQKVDHLLAFLGDLLY